MKKIRTPAVLRSGSARRRLPALLLGLLLPLTSAALETPTPTEGASPYLSMHQSDPVQWRHWGPEVLAEAQRRNLPIFISVGYYTCYWCHVMQRESFRDSGIATLLNTRFIPVIVDREISPGLDAQLISFMESYSGSAGWPLNAILTPEGYPFLGAIYLPRDNLAKMLSALADQWPQQSAKLTATAQQAARQLRTNNGTSSGDAIDDDEAARAFRARLQVDATAVANDFNGGFGEQSKFPVSPLLQSLLHQVAIGEGGTLTRILKLTLDNMAAGNLRDHQRGGFFRYTSDPDWYEPHFEKMLYDNAQIAQVYFRAAKVFNREDYERIGRSTLDFMADNMRSDAGTFIAALSSTDQAGIEGGFYRWTTSDLQAVFGADDYEYARRNWPLPRGPEPEHGYLLPPLTTGGDPRLLRIRDKLLAARPSRQLPADEKRLAGWNGLALSAFTTGAMLPGGERYRRIADDLRREILRTYVQGDTLFRLRPAQGAGVPGTLEDYAWVLQGLLAWEELPGGKESDLKVIRRLFDRAWRIFYDEHGWLASAGTLLPLPRARVHLQSRHLFSPSASLIDVCMTLADRSKDGKLRQQCLTALRRNRYELIDNPLDFADYGPLLDRLAETIVAGGSAPPARKSP